MTIGKNKKIAIACQGGGSHTAFAAGVLREVLRQEKQPFEIVGLSGTSGGAICALMAWYGLAKGNRQQAIELLNDFWNQIAAIEPWDIFFNFSMVWTARLQGAIALPEISPYFFPSFGQDKLRNVLEDLVNFNEAKQIARVSNLKLFVGAVDVLSGDFKVFRGEEVTIESILASTALPTLFKAVHIDGGVYWDGLFSRNPPIRDLCHLRPDEIWVIQINPQKRHEEPKLVHEIQDRRNELAGNLSLNQEIHFIKTINELLEKNLLINSHYRPITVRRLEFTQELDFASKLDRSPSFLKDIVTFGEERAAEFIKGVF